MASKQTPRTELDVLVEISAKLDRLTGILATQGMDRDAKIASLAALGFSSAQIAPLVGMSAGAIRTRKSRQSK